MMTSKSLFCRLQYFGAIIFKSTLSTFIILVLFILDVLLSRAEGELIRRVESIRIIVVYLKDRVYVTDFTNYYGPGPLHCY